MSPSKHNDVAITPEDLADLVAARRVEAIKNLVGFVNHVLIVHYPDFYWKGFVDLCNTNYDAEWQAFHADVIREFEQRSWFGPFKIERMSDVEYDDGPNGIHYMSPTYRFHLKLPMKKAEG
jgi:hypothetical protein